MRRALLISLLAVASCSEPPMERHEEPEYLACQQGTCPTECRNPRWVETDPRGAVALGIECYADGTVLRYEQRTMPGFPSLGTNPVVWETWSYIDDGLCSWQEWPASYPYCFSSILIDGAASVRGRWSE